MPENHYTGKMVLVEQANPGNNRSSCYDGEKIVLRETPNQLFTIDMSTVYGGISVYGLGGSTGGKQIPLSGESRYNVVDVYPIPDWVWDDLSNVEQEIAEVLSGERKGQWVTSVYGAAKTTCRRLREIQAEQQKGAYSEPQRRTDRIQRDPGEGVVRPTPSQQLLRYFEFTHLPEPLRSISVSCYELAQAMEDSLPDGPEKTAGLRKLLEAKDCFVRAALPPAPAKAYIDRNAQ